MTYSYSKMPSPVGELLLIANDNALIAILWGEDDAERVKMGAISEDKTHPVLREAERQLTAYFNGDLTSFDLPLHFKGTQFQQDVWKALLSIPYGETRSYAQIAAQIGRPKAVRAVGMANSKNPISIIAPCHRVIGTNGTLTGYAGGLDKKICLLNLEAKNMGKTDLFSLAS